MRQAAEQPRLRGLVLVADDDADVRKMIRTMLEIDGYEVSEARDGMEAWEMIVRDRPPVVITDIQMPGHDGLELCRLVKANGLHETRMIVFTAGMASEAESPAAGCDAYFLKTEPLPRLRGIVRQLLPG
ncbi:MAG TPA: response regulator [Candidatus Limnocylindrales bacterium]|nr:response regulator [Candidatus Limnocylindrales bacterium]